MTRTDEPDLRPARASEDSDRLADRLATMAGRVRIATGGTSTIEGLQLALKVQREAVAEGRKLAASLKADIATAKALAKQYEAGSVAIPLTTIQAAQIASVRR